MDERRKAVTALSRLLEEAWSEELIAVIAEDADITVSLALVQAASRGWIEVDAALDSHIAVAQEFLASNSTGGPHDDA